MRGTTRLLPLGHWRVWPVGEWEELIVSPRTWRRSVSDCSGTLWSWLGADALATLPSWRQPPLEIIKCRCDGTAKPQSNR